MALPLPYKDDVTLSLNVRDLAAALAWYQRVLGFETIYVVQEIGWAEMRTHVPNVTIGLGESAEMPAPGGGATPVWGVTDIAAARARLEAEDVRFDGPTRTIPDMVKLATFYDLDGNPMMLVESLAGAPC